ncbi:MAG: cupin domain-containing protein [Gammaproteobacteria bacterium]|nr:cupin domain-containing protein [Gammaproteobacteria bacterium]MDH3412822.1 cupin domain-containing protein [Gammaproteobacteria bacterium]
MIKAPWIFQLRGDPRGIARKLGEGIETCVFPGERVMLSVVRVEPNSTGTVHSHPEEQWGVLLEGRCTRIQNGEEVEATAGDFWYTPGGVSHGVRTGAASALILDIFSPPRAEYRQAGEGFGKAEIKAV